MHRTKKNRAFEQNKRINLIGVSPVNPVMYWSSAEFYCCDTQMRFK